jgi:hypothetical protein
MAVFMCPDCGHAQAVEDKHIGKSATCPKCKTQGVVEKEQAPVAFVEEPSADDGRRRVEFASVGPLGIRCDSWIDHSRHINAASTLQIGWWTIIDETLPVRFNKVCGLTVHNEANDYPFELVYKASTCVEVFDEEIKAFEVRYLTFNTWAEHVSTLVAEEIRDGQPGKQFSRTHAWRLFSENEAESFCTSLCFVSRVRLASGGIAVADTGFVLREAQRIAERVTESDLSPKPPSRT